LLPSHHAPTPTPTTPPLHDALPIFRADSHDVQPHDALLGARGDELHVSARLRGGEGVIERHEARPEHGDVGVPVALACRLSLPRSEEHTSDSSHLGISYAVFCLKKK